MWVSICCINRLNRALPLELWCWWWSVFVVSLPWLLRLVFPLLFHCCLILLHIILQGITASPLRKSTGHFHFHPLPFGLSNKITLWLATEQALITLAGPKGKTTCSLTVCWEGLGLPWCCHRSGFPCVLHIPHTPVAKVVFPCITIQSAAGRYMIPDDIMGTNHVIIHLSPDMLNNLQGIPRLNYHLGLYKWYQAWGRYSSARTGRKLSNQLGGVNMNSIIHTKCDCPKHIYIYIIVKLCSNLRTKTPKHLPNLSGKD